MCKAASAPQLTITQLRKGSKMELNRKEARTAVYEILFEREFRGDDDPTAIFETASNVRDIPDDAYIREVFYGVVEREEEINSLIEKFANGWKIGRISRPALCAMRIAIYEMKYTPDIPFTVSINEAIELVKRYDDEKTKGFVNGVLNGIKNLIIEESDESFVLVKNTAPKKKGPKPHGGAEKHA